jgi:hypothetical protein
MLVYCVNLCCVGCTKKISRLYTTDSGIGCRSKIIFKDDLFVRPHHVTLYYLAPILKTQQYVTLTLVRKCIVVLCYVNLHFGKDFFEE